MILGEIREITQNLREIKYRFDLNRFVLKLIKFNRQFNDISSIVYEVIRTIPSLFIFFLRKDFERTKTRHKEKSTNKNKQTLNNKYNNFSRTQNF